MWLRVLLTWVLFIPIPIINGLLREKWYKPLVGDFISNIIGFLVLSLFFIIYAYFSLKLSVDFLTTRQLFLIGAFWLILTLIFEFGMGFLMGRSLTYMLADYNLFNGRLWPLVLIVIFFSPYIVKFLRFL